MITLLSWLWWWVLPVRKGLAIQNLNLCFPQLPAATIRQSMLLLLRSMWMLLRGNRAALSLPPGIENGGVLLAGHGLGWDIALLTLAERVPVTCFLREPSNPLIARWIKHLRDRVGIDGLYGRGTYVQAERALRSGRLVVFVMDQRHNDGIRTQFLGRSCLTSAAFGRMLQQHQPKLYGAWQWLEEDTVHAEISALTWKLDVGIEALTQRSQEWIGQQIAKRPTQWLWLHNRWHIPNQSSD